MRVLVYGLGKSYIDNQDYIHERYRDDEILYCDKDYSKVERKKDAISIEEIEPQAESIDRVLVTPLKADIPAIVSDLLLRGIVSEKIEVLSYIRFFEENSRNDLFCGMRFMGQFSDDAILMYLCEKIGIPINEVEYLEIGTNDPVFQNNTIHFYRMGARGILVDPLPASKCLSLLSRPNDKFVQGAVVGDKEADEISFFIGKGSQISSTKKELAGEVLRQISVPVYNINDLLRMFKRTPTMLLIDAEGQDESILYGMDFENYAPLIIEFEADKADPECIHGYLRENGYVQFVKIGGNQIFLRKDQMGRFENWKWE